MPAASGSPASDYDGIFGPAVLPPYAEFVKAVAPPMSPADLPGAALATCCCAHRARAPRHNPVLRLPRRARADGRRGLVQPAPRRVPRLRLQHHAPARREFRDARAATSPGSKPRASAPSPRPPRRPPPAPRGQGLPVPARPRLPPPQRRGARSAPRPPRGDLRRASSRPSTARWSHRARRMARIRVVDGSWPAGRRRPLAARRRRRPAPAPGPATSSDADRLDPGPRSPAPPPPPCARPGSGPRPRPTPIHDRDVWYRTSAAPDSGRDPPALRGAWRRSPRSGSTACPSWTSRSMFEAHAVEADLGAEAELALCFRSLQRGARPPGRRAAAGARG